MGELKQKVFKGTIWLTVEKLYSQAVDFVLGMVLARLLTPNDYGTVALTTIFFVVARTLADCGLGQSLIQKKDADDLDFNSVFYASLALVSAVYGALFFAAPLIARFFHEPQLVAIVRVSGLTLICFAVNSVQTAEMTRQLRFDLMLKISMIVGFANAVIGISLALMGFGVWALVLSGVLTGVVNVFVRWFFIAWRPKLEFSFARVRGLLSFGWKVAASDLLGNFFGQLSGMLIGKFYTKTDLAFVEKGSGLPMRAFSAVEAATGSSAYPALVRLQDDRERMLSAMRRVSQCAFFLVAPIMTFIAVCAPDIILVLFGHQWLPAVPYMRIACFGCALWPLTGIQHKALMATGRAGAILTLNLVRNALTLLIIFVFMRYSVLTYQLASGLIGGPVSYLLHAWPNRRYLGFRFRFLLNDVLPTVLVCLVLAAVSLAAGALLARVGWLVSDEPRALTSLARVAVQGLAGALAYLTVSFAFRLQPLGEFLNIVRVPVAHRAPWLSKTRFFGGIEKWMAHSR